MIDNDAAFDALAAIRRRELLVGLLEDEPQPVTELSEESRVLAEANETYLRMFLEGPIEISGVEKEMVELHHVDLPKLVEHGYVDWTPGDRVVWRGPRFDELRPVLELLADEREPSVPTVEMRPR